MELDIRAPGPDDFRGWKHLWDQYLVFYETQLPDGHAEDVWGRIQDPEDPIECLVAADGETLVGFTHFLPHADTWDARPICYLQDLLVEREFRSVGIGRALVEAVVDRARSRGWSRVYWQTADDNATARVLYDRLTGGATGFIVYDLDTSR